MPLVDAKNIFSDKQTLTVVSYSQKTLDMKEASDFGIGHNLYAVVYTQGDFSFDLRVQVLGHNNPSVADSTPVVIGDSGVVPLAELTHGSRVPVRIDETGKKYRYLTLRYIPSVNGTGIDPVEAVEASEGVEAVEGTEEVTVNSLPNFAMPTPVGEEDTPIADTLRAQLESIASVAPLYRAANADKATA